MATPKTRAARAGPLSHVLMPVLLSPFRPTRGCRRCVAPVREPPPGRSASQHARRIEVMKRQYLIVAVALAAALAGCTTGVDTAASEPPVMSEALRPLVGHWRGTIWETGSVFYQGQAALALRVAADAPRGG